MTTPSKITQNGAAGIFRLDDMPRMSGMQLRGARKALLAVIEQIDARLAVLAATDATPAATHEPAVALSARVEASRAALHPDARSEAVRARAALMRETLRAIRPA